MSELRTGLTSQNDPDAIMRRAAAAAHPSNGNVVPFPQTGGAPSPAAGPPDAIRAQTVAWWTQNAGVPVHVAQGIADQVNKESGFDPTLPGDSGTSIGLYQAHNERKQSLQERPNWQDPNVQHAWALSQVTGGDPIATQHWNEIKNAKSREEASRLWQQYFERPAGSAGADHEQRLSAGREELARVGAQVSRLVDQLTKEGGRSEETWKRLREATDKMNEYQQKALELAQKPPSPDPRDAFQRLGGLATVVGILGGLLTKRPLIASLDAAGAAMEAYNKGDEVTYQYERENWKRQSDTLLKLAQFQHEQIRDVLYDENMQAGQRMNTLHAILSSLGMEQQAALAQVGDERALRLEADRREQAQRQFVTMMRRLDEMENKLPLPEQYIKSLDKQWKDEHPGETMPESVRQEHIKQAQREVPGARGEKLGKPTTFEVPDPADPKKRTQITLQQAADGTWVTLDKKPYDLPADARPLTASQMGARESIFAQRGITSGSDVRSDLKNITELPAFTTRGILSGFASQPPVSMLDATRKNLGNLILTDEASGAMTDQMVGIARALASLETGGVYVNQHLVDQYEKLAPQAGDSGLRVLRKLGIMRQNAENALEGSIHNPRLSDSQREYVEEIVKGVREAIPWTPHDVNQLEFHGGDTQTIADFAKKQGFGGTAGGKPGSLDVTESEYAKLPVGAAYTVPGDSTVRYKH